MILFVKNIIDDYKLEYDYAQELVILIEDIMNKYDFLVIRKESWEKAFRRIVSKNVSITEVEFRILKCIRNLIHRYQSRKDTVYLNNYIVKLLSNNIKGIDLLKQLMAFMKKYDVVFDQEYFNKLKEESEAFNRVLESIKIENYSFEEFNNYINGYYNAYLLLKPFNKSLGWTIDTFNYLKSLLNYPLEPLKEENVKNEANYKKVKLIINNYDKLDAIYNLFKDNIMVVRRKKFDQVVFNYSYQEIEELFNDYIVYRDISYDKDLNFLLKIASRINNDNPEVKVVKEENVVKGKRSYNKRTDYKCINNVYDLFTYGDKTLEEKKPVVDYLLSRREKKTIKELDLFLQDKLDRKTRDKITRVILSIRVQYKNWVDMAQLPKNCYNGCFSVYDLFTYGDKTLEEKKPIVDYLLSRCEEKTVQAILDYVGDNLNSKEKKKVRATLTQLRQKYHNWVDTGKLPGVIRKQRDMMYLINIISGLSFKGNLYKDLSLYNEKKVHLIALGLKLKELKIRSDGVSKEEYNTLLTNSLNLIIDNNIISLYDLFKTYVGIDEEIVRR